MTKTAQIWQEAAQLAEQHAVRYGDMPRGCLQVLAQALREKAAAATRETEPEWTDDASSSR